jgi:hypothetical protein
MKPKTMKKSEMAGPIAYRQVSHKTAKFPNFIPINSHSDVFLGLTMTRLSRTIRKDDSKCQLLLPEWFFTSETSQFWSAHFDLPPDLQTPIGNPFAVFHNQRFWESCNRDFCNGKSPATSWWSARGSHSFCGSNKTASASLNLVVFRL